MAKHVEIKQINEGLITSNDFFEFKFGLEIDGVITNNYDVQFCSFAELIPFKATRIDLVGDLEITEKKENGCGYLRVFKSAGQGIYSKKVTILEGISKKKLDLLVFHDYEHGAELIDDSPALTVTHTKAHKVTDPRK